MKKLILAFAFLLVCCTKQKTSGITPPGSAVETDAKPSATHPYAGFWKVEASDTWGLAIGPFDETRYYVSFCGPGGSFDKGDYRNATTIVGDSQYKIVDTNTLEVKGRSGFTTYFRSEGRTSNTLIKK
jgi:hypothetical protein